MQTAVKQKEVAKVTRLESAFALSLIDGSCRSYGGILVMTKAGVPHQVWIATKDGEGDGAIGPSASIHIETFEYRAILSKG